MVIVPRQESASDISSIVEASGSNVVRLRAKDASGQDKHVVMQSRLVPYVDFLNIDSKIMNLALGAVNEKKLREAYEQVHERIPSEEDMAFSMGWDATRVIMMKMLDTRYSPHFGEDYIFYSAVIVRNLLKIGDRVKMITRLEKEEQNFLLYGEAKVRSGSRVATISQYIGQKVVNSQSQ